MHMKSTLSAGMLGIAVALAAAIPAHSETLRVMNGAASSSLTVPMNRAVVVEADQPFAQLSIANPGIADISTLSDRSIYVLGKAPGRTTLTLLGENGSLIANVDVHVSIDVGEFKERLQQILPGEQIEVRTAADSIVLSGTVSSAAKLDRALDLAERYAPGRVSNLMNVGGVQQVMLKVRIAEMQRSVSKELSSAIGASVTRGTFKPSGGYSTSSAGGSAESGLGFSLTRGSFELNVLLEALESKGLVRTLAEPNLTALSGQEADFLAGGELPIPTRGDNNTISIEYKPFGVELKFTPRVVDGDLINLEISTAVSSIDSSIVTVAGGTTINGFKTRRTTTTVEMRDGESFAIAGLLQDDFTDGASQVPWLGDVPVLGSLFRSVDFQRKQSELVIIITPHLVTPVRGEALALPTDRVRPPTEAELFLLGKTAGNRSAKGAVAEVAKQDFSGSYGYVME
ncbi:pilus assembly protein CpaC [Albidovulum inexpectatum]|uniref:Pilus assembly protein CpaC n=1 Tax=Albidovulum inexpectatum TaxID=196587 RepID=A0A2S5JGZ5_9RHOB|nr:type II and III secretion system protein family protein [Albidovulum inexpectatum]PPB80628.1 pilus assembly protein CpaC [Albidovulum inexpectatum]